MRNLYLFIIQWIVGIYSFYNLFFQLKYFEGDIFTNMILSGVSEMAATFIGGQILNKFGLSKTYFISNIIGSVCCILYIFFGSVFPWLIPFLLIGAFFGFCSAILLNWVGT